MPSVSDLRRRARAAALGGLHAAATARRSLKQRQAIREGVRALDREIARFWNPTATRSVVFLHNNYYNFLYLAAALRERGWSAMAVSMEAPDHPDQMYFHGEDINLSDPDPVVEAARVAHFFEFVRTKVAMIHVGQVGRMSFYQENTDGTFFRERIPWDFLELKRAGVKIGYTHHGCCDLVSQSSFRRWSGDMCSLCAWEQKPALCSDVRNLAWGHTVQLLADLICIETDPMLDYKAHPKVYREPLTFAMDPDFWRPDLEVPAELRVDREPGEVLVYHAVGNVEERWRDGENAKGSRAVLDALDALRARGLPVRLLTHPPMHSRDVRFMQVQADIVIDQLLYGRYGATAREAMMLGKPTLGRVNPDEELEGAQSRCILETAIVHATRASVVDVLEELVASGPRREAIGRASREHAMQWWSAQSCARRYEAVFDRLVAGKPPMEVAVQPLWEVPVPHGPSRVPTQGTAKPVGGIASDESR